MIFLETAIPDVLIVEPERFEDERGFFALSWSHAEFAARGLNPNLTECNISFSKKRGILRGMHYQASPYAQAKLVRCTMGAIYDVAIDLRPDSPTLNRWVAVELSAENRRMLYIPEGFAHGFQTLVDETEIFYQMSSSYQKDAGRGVRWNDEAFNIEWPITDPVMIDRDRDYPLLNK
jgi:dTDP-4-dehydrorhamnose 3,5-epimerase